MTGQAGPADPRRRIPAALLTGLRAAHRAGDAAETAFLAEKGLRRLAGGRNNDVLAWDDAGVCVKLYRRADRGRVLREWYGLSHGAALGHAPEPLWLDEHPDHSDRPALGMALVAGAPILDALAPASAVHEIAAVTRALQDRALTGPLAGLDRVDSIGHYIARLTEVWPHQLDHADAAAADGGPSERGAGEENGEVGEDGADPPVEEMRALLRCWTARGDTALLGAPGCRVFSRGDANLLNWLHDDPTTVVVDFEYSGFSDLAVDAADQIEHISARAVPDDVWAGAENALGVTPGNRRRFDAARRTIALRWLAVLWKQRATRPGEFVAQHRRVRDLLGLP